MAPDMDASAPQLLLLGTPVLARGAVHHTLPDSLPGYLVAYLAQRGDWVSREHLATLLWPDAAQEEAQHNLRVNLNRLRPLLRSWGVEPALTAERRRLLLQMATDTAAQSAALERGDWQVAASLPRGPFLHGVSFRAFPVLGEWARTERDSCLSQWRRAILAAAPPLAPANACSLAERFLEHDPLEEEVLRVQLAALAALGRGADVQRVFDAYAERARGFGVDASAALIAFAQGLAATPSAGSAAFDDEPLIGREREVPALVDAIATHRMVSVTGLGGVGKTRLAHEAVRLDRARFPAGVWWIDARHLSNPGELPRRLVDDLPRSSAQPLQRLAERIGSRPALLVLDNAEALFGEREALVSVLQALLAACTPLRVLLTACEPLKCADERLLHVDGLSVPASDGAALESPAVRLFVAHARRARPGFDPRTVRAELATIARLTGGMPLALRLAAVWIRLLPCAAIVDELRRDLAALDGGAQQGVRAILQRSWSRLAPEAQQALARLAAFGAGFGIDAARAVAQADLRLTADLVERSLLMQSALEGSAMFELHPLVRQFVRERLAAAPRDEQQAFAQHAAWMASRLRTLSEISPAAQKDLLMPMRQLLGDAVQAFRWSAANGRADLLVALAPALGSWYEATGHWDEGIALFGAAEATLDPDERQELAALAALARLRGTLLYRKSDYDAAEIVLLRGLHAARALEHRGTIKSCLNSLGLTLWMQGRYADAAGRFEEALELARADGDRLGEAKFSSNLALLLKVQGDFAGAAQRWRETLGVDRELGEWQGAANTLNNLGNAERALRRLQSARELLEEGLRLCDEHGFASTRSFLLVNLALVHFDARRDGPARSFAELALAEASRSGEQMIVPACHLLLARLSLRGQHPEHAASHLVEALRRTHALGDVQNQLEALDGFACWLASRGQPERAHPLWLAIERHPKLHAELRIDLATHRDEVPLDAPARERAEHAAGQIDVVAATAMAIAELESSRLIPELGRTAPSGVPS